LREHFCIAEYRVIACGMTQGRYMLCGKLEKKAAEGRRLAAGARAANQAHATNIFLNN
jgi:hypothetical protein